MAMVVKNNMSAVSTLNTLNKNSSALQKSLAKVSSGMKINSAQDDASGYAISEKMRVQIRSLDQANQNTQNASSMMKTAEGAVSSTVEILKSLKEKAINAATDTNTDSDRVTIQKELDQFIDQIDDNALTTFNGKYMVDGSKAQYGKATFTAMTNQSLASDTDGATKLTALKNRNNESLEIESTDYVTASFVKNGETYTTKFSVGADTDLETIFTNLNSIKDANGKAVEPFGPAQTSTAKMDATQASTLLKNVAGAGNAADTLNKVAAGTYTASSSIKDADGNDATADQIKQAIKTLLDDSTQGESAVMSALGAANATSFTSATDNLKAEIAGKAVGIASSFNQVSVANSASVGNNANLGTGATVTNAVEAKFYDKTGTANTDTAYTVTFKIQDGATANTNTASGSNVNGAAQALTQSEKDAYADKVLASVDNIAAKNATGDTTVKIADAVKDGTTLTVKANGAELKLGTGASDTDSVTLKTTAVTLDTATAMTGNEDSVKDYAIAKAVQATQGGGLVLAKTSAVGLKTSQDLQSTADGTNGVTITAANSGIQNQVSGVTISITDSEGQVKKSANAALDQFRTVVYAKNESDRNELTFQVGANANQSITVGLDDMRAEALGLKSSDGKKVSVATQDNANAAVAVFDNAIQKAIDQQTTIGAVEARLDYTSQNLTTMSENTQAAESTIRDADMAKEMTNYTKNNVLLQAAQSMLAQANQSSSQVLSLLQ